MVTKTSWYVRLGSPAVLVVGVLAYVVVLRAMLATQNPNLFPTLLLIGAATVPCAVLLFVYAAGRAPSGHAGLVALTAIVGGAIGTTSASMLEYSTLKAMPWLGMLAVGVIEETVKLIVPLVVFLVGGRRVAGLGVVLGVASGTGFAVLETMGYGFTALLASQGNVAAVDQTLLLRALLAPAGHVAWTGLAAGALWRTGRHPRPRHALRGFLLTYLGVILLHTTWDGTQSLMVHIAVAAISVIALLIDVLLDRHRATTHQLPPQPAGMLPQPDMTWRR